VSAVVEHFDLRHGPAPSFCPQFVPKLLKGVPIDPIGEFSANTANMLKMVLEFEVRTPLDCALFVARLDGAKRRERLAD
jgi:hypothetical protein